MYKNTSGFNFPIFFIAIALIALLGFVTWRIWDSNQHKQITADTQQSQQPEQTEQKQEPQQAPQTDLNAGYVVIKEWDVRFKPVEGLEGVEYSIGVANGSNSNVAYFSTAVLADYGDSCSASQTGSAPLGRLIRTQGTKENTTPISTSYTVQIGDYYYQYATPQAVCSDNAMATNLQTQTLGYFKAAIKSLEMAK